MYAILRGESINGLLADIGTVKSMSVCSWNPVVRLFIEYHGWKKEKKWAFLTYRIHPEDFVAPLLYGIFLLLSLLFTRAPDDGALLAECDLDEVEIRDGKNSDSSCKNGLQQPTQTFSATGHYGICVRQARAMTTLLLLDAINWGTLILSDR